MSSQPYSHTLLTFVSIIKRFYPLALFTLILFETILTHSNRGAPIANGAVPWLRWSCLSWWTVSAAEPAERVYGCLRRLWNVIHRRMSIMLFGRNVWSWRVAIAGECWTLSTEHWAQRYIYKIGGPATTREPLETAGDRWTVRNEQSSTTTIYLAVNRKWSLW